MDDKELLQSVVKNPRVSVVDEAGYGVYLWKMPDGRYIGDGQGNFLSVNSMKGDIRNIAAMREAAKDCGVTEGEAVFFAGQRKVSDDEYDEQLDRMDSGLIPDEYDIPALVESARNGK